RSTGTVKNIIPSAIFVIPGILKQKVSGSFCYIKVFFISGHEVGDGIAEYMPADHAWIFMTVGKTTPVCVKIGGESSRIAVHSIFRPIGEYVIYCLIFPIIAIQNSISV